MEINKGYVFYRYAEDNDEDSDIQKVELYVALNNTKAKDATVILMNLEDYEDMWEIANHDLLGTDLVLLEPHYHLEFSESVSSVLSRVTASNHEEKMNCIIRTIPDNKQINNKLSFLHNAHIPMHIDGTDNVYMYDFLSFDQIKEVLTKCMPLTAVWPLGNKDKINDFIATLVFDMNVIMLGAKELLNTDVVNDCILKAKCPDYTIPNTHMHEIEDAVRIYMKEDYICVPYTPAFDLDEITKPHVVIASPDKKFYIVFYAPIESYLDRGLREDPETQEICDFLAKNM